MVVATVRDNSKHHERSRLTARPQNRSMPACLPSGTIADAQSASFSALTLGLAEQTRAMLRDCNAKSQCWCKEEEEKEKG